MIWILNTCGVFIIDKMLMTVTFLVSLLIVGIAFAISRICGIDKPWMSYFLLTTTCLFVSSVNCSLTYHATLLYLVPLIYAAQYSGWKTTTYVFCMSVICVYVSTMIGYFSGIVDLNMLVISHYPNLTYSDLADETLLYELVDLDFNPWVIVPLYFVLPRSIILAVLGRQARILGYSITEMKA